MRILGRSALEIAPQEFRIETGNAVCTLGSVHTEALNHHDPKTYVFEQWLFDSLRGFMANFLSFIDIIRARRNDLLQLSRTANPPVISIIDKAYAAFELKVSQIIQIRNEMTSLLNEY